MGPFCHRCQLMRADILSSSRLMGAELWWSLKGKSESLLAAAIHLHYIMYIWHMHTSSNINTQSRWKLLHERAGYHKLALVSAYSKTRYNSVYLLPLTWYQMDRTYCGWPAIQCFRHLLDKLSENGSKDHQTTLNGRKLQTLIPASPAHPFL